MIGELPLSPAIGAREVTRRGLRLQAWAPLMWFVGAALFYLSLRSINYAGDGLRWYRAAFGPRPVAGLSNHLLYPTLLWLWERLLQGTGLAGSGISETVGHLQMLNVLLAALGLALFSALVLRLSGSGRAAFLATALLGLSFAYSSHATDMTEVVPAFPLVCGALLIAVRSWDHRTQLAGAIGCGALLSLATLLYQTSLLAGLAIAAAFGARQWIDGRPRWRAVVKDRLVWAFGLTTALGVTIGYLLGTAMLVSRRPAAVALYLAQRPDGGFWKINVNPIHFVGLVFGWANGQLGLVDWVGGFRLLDGGLTPPAAFDIGAVLVVIATVGALVFWLAKQRKAEPRLIATLVVLGSWFILPALFAGFFANTYAKFWQQPMAAWAGLLALPLAAWSARPSRRGAWLLGGLVVLTGVTNLSVHLIPAHTRPDTALVEAEQLSTVIGPNDLLIADGWDEVAANFTAFYTRPYISYRNLAADLKFDNQALQTRIETTVRDTQARGGHVYSIALLDQSAGDWADYYGRLFGLDYDSLSDLRTAARAVPGTDGWPEPVMVLERI